MYLIYFLNGLPKISSPKRIKSYDSYLVITPSFFVSFGIHLPQVATLTGHSMRVLYLAMSPDGQVLHCSFIVKIICTIINEHVFVQELVN